MASVDVWLASTAVGVFSDHIVGVIKNDTYRLIRPKKLLVTTGAREKMALFSRPTPSPVYTVLARFKP